MTTSTPETIHDFGGFPEQLYKLQYRAHGAPDVATEAGRLLAEAGFIVQSDSRRGLDHGAWVPMTYLQPEARLPVFQVSMPHDLDAAGAVRLGKALAPLRDRGVLIVGSGSLTHNLYEVFRGQSDVEYAQSFVDWIRRAVTQKNTAALIDYRHQAPSASRAHPTEEHFLPLLVALGAAEGAASVALVEGGMTYGVLSMDSFLWQ
jgi:4,5-DOPA dioxygenase extradiol